MPHAGGAHRASPRPASPAVSFTFTFRWALVFLSALATDVCWARYVTDAAAGRRWWAATWGAGIYVVGALTIIEYTRDHWMVVPAVLGAFVGTALGVTPSSAPRDPRA